MRTLVFIATLLLAGCINDADTLRDNESVLVINACQLGFRPVALRTANGDLLIKCATGENEQ